MENSGNSLQLDAQGKLRHFLSIEGLPPQILHAILRRADQFIDDNQYIKKAPLLADVTIINLFFETSTRTRTTFELAEKWLGANVVNLNIGSSATKKGESLLDTVWNLQAMHADMFVIRHAQSGAAHFIAQQVKPHVAVINAGDGRHAHPTQALLDAYTIAHYKKNFAPLKICLVGDILHSRVALSEIHTLSSLGVGELRVVAPKTLLPSHIEQLGVHVYHDLSAGLQDADVVMMLRLQQERMQSGLLPNEQEYYHHYALTPERLAKAKADALVMHPGPMNRGVEIASVVADGKQSVILSQVNFGIAIRMAVMAMLQENRTKSQRGRI